MSAQIPCRPLVNCCTVTCRQFPNMTFAPRKTCYNKQQPRASSLSMSQHGLVYPKFSGFSSVFPKKAEKFSTIFHNIILELLYILPIPIQHPLTRYTFFCSAVLQGRKISPYGIRSSFPQDKKMARDLLHDLWPYFSIYTYYNR